MTTLCAEPLQPNIAPIIANACVIDDVSGRAAVSAKDVIKNALSRISRNSAPQLVDSGCELVAFHCEVRAVV
jgi:hypothetical protein